LCDNQLICFSLKIVFVTQLSVTLKWLTQENVANTKSLRYSKPLLQEVIVSSQNAVVDFRLDNDVHIKLFACLLQINVFKEWT